MWSTSARSNVARAAWRAAALGGFLLAGAGGCKASAQADSKGADGQVTMTAGSAAAGDDDEVVIPRYRVQLDRAARIGQQTAFSVTAALEASSVSSVLGVVKQRAFERTAVELVADETVTDVDVDGQVSAATWRVRSVSWATENGPEPALGAPGGEVQLTRTPTGWYATRGGAAVSDRAALMLQYLAPGGLTLGAIDPSQRAAVRDRTIGERWSITGSGMARMLTEAGIRLPVDQLSGTVELASVSDGAAGPTASLVAQLSAGMVAGAGPAATTEIPDIAKVELRVSAAYPLAEEYPPTALAVDLQASYTSHSPSSGGRELRTDKLWKLHVDWSEAP